MNNHLIPQPVVEVSETLKKAGFEAYLVGGCVRDTILGRKPKDWDITTNANPQQIQALFEKTVYENKFGTVMVMIPTEVTPTRMTEVIQSGGCVEFFFVTRLG